MLMININYVKTRTFLFFLFFLYNSTVIPLVQFVGNREKGESQNGCFKKAKHAKISEKQTFLTS